jgi:hypothetical protein
LRGKIEDDQSSFIVCTTTLNQPLDVLPFLSCFIFTPHFFPVLFSSTSAAPQSKIITMRAPSFEHLEFERKVNDALKSVERILDVERHPRLAGDVEHTYGSKYALVDTTTNAALIAYMNVFEKMGLNSSVLKSIDKTKPTTIRFDANTNCTFEKEQDVNIPMQVTFEEEHKTKTSGIFGNADSKRISKVSWL